MDSSGSAYSYGESRLTNKKILVTGPPLNGRDDYIKQTISSEKGIGYYHIYDYMVTVAEKFGFPNVTRTNILNIPQYKLQQIRSAAFDEIDKKLRNSTNKIELISTPANFRVKPGPVAPDGRINGLNENDITKIDPDLIIVFIADLLEVKKNLLNDPVWKDRVNPDLKTLAEWRRMTIDSMMEYRERVLAQKGKVLDIIIFAKGHDFQTFNDLLIGDKPRIYLSYPITGSQDESMQKLRQIKNILKNNFVCIDPYSIKDWGIINAYDNVLRSGKSEIEIPDTDVILQLGEVTEAINEIRAQTVERDYKLIEGTHATVVCHITEDRSYGVMSEMIYTVTRACNPLYVLYPFRSRPSPFFEYYADPDNIIHGDEIESMTKLLSEKMLGDIEKGAWPRKRASVS